MRSFPPAGPANIAAGFLVHRAGQRVLLHLRGPENDPDPNVWAAIGGHEELDDAGDLRRTWCRELREELGIEADPDDLQEIIRLEIGPARVAAVFVLEVETVDLEFEVTEGRGVAWFTIPEAMALPDLAEVTRADLPRIARWMDTVGT